MVVPPNSQSNYESKKEELGRMVVEERATAAQIAKRLGVSQATAYMWRQSFISEIKIRSEPEIARLQNEFINLVYMDLTKAIKEVYKIMNSKDVTPKIKLEAINTNLNVIKVKTELLSRFGVIPAQKIDQTITDLTKIKEFMAGIKED